MNRNLRPGLHVPKAVVSVSVKDGRHAGGAACCDVSASLLDGPEHGGRMVCAGIGRSRLVAALVVDRSEWSSLPLRHLSACARGDAGRGADQEDSTMTQADTRSQKYLTGIASVHSAIILLPNIELQ